MPSESPSIDIIPTEPAVTDAPPVGDAYDVAFAEQLSPDVDAPEGMALEPMEGRVVAPAVQELDTQGDAMMHLIEDIPVSPGLGNELNALELPSTSVNMEAVLDDPAKLPEDLKEVNPEALKADAAEIQDELAKKTPEQMVEIEKGIHNFGYRFEKGKNEILANVFTKVGEMIGGDGIESTKGKKGAVARFVAGLSENYKERNEDLDKKMEKIEESRKNGGMSLMQKAGSTMQVTGAMLRYGRIAADAIGWTAAAPWRFGQLAATIGETTLSAGKEARLKNEDVIDKTRIQDSAEAEEEAYAMYTAQMAKQGIEIKKDEKGNVQLEGVSTKQLSAEYKQRIPQDLLNRLGRAPKEGEGTGILQDAMRAHIALEAKNQQKKIDAIEADTTLTNEQREKKIEQALESWGNSKMLKDFDRMLSQQGVVDGIAMSARYGSKAAKAASMALSAQSLLLLWDKFSDVLSVGEKVTEGAGGAAGTMLNPDNAILEMENAPIGAPGASGAVFGVEKTLDDTVTINSASLGGESDFNTVFNPSGVDTLSTEGALPHEALGAYAVKSGDTMTSILKARFPGITDTQIENLRTHDLSALGIKNIDKINIDQKIDLDKIGEVLKAGKGSGVALRTPPAGGIVGKMFADEPTDFRGATHELTDPIHTPTTVTTEPFPQNTVVPPRVRGAEDAEIVSRTTTPTKPVSTEAVTEAHENIPRTSISQENIIEQETGVQATTRLERPSGLYEAKVARIDNARAEALREAEAWHKRKLADLARRHDGGIVKDNVGTANKGIKNIVNVLTGRQDGDRAISSMTREITGRVQGGITDEMKYAQAIEKANFDYQDKIARAEEAFTRARIRLDEKEMEDAAKEAAKAAKDAARLAAKTKVT